MYVIVRNGNVHLDRSRIRGPGAKDGIEVLVLQI